MNAIATGIPDVLIIEPKVFGDERGFFYKSFNQKAWEETTGLKTRLVACLPNTLKVYDCMDNHEGFGNVPEKLVVELQ